MTLTGKVIAIESGEEYVDKVERMTVRITSEPFGPKLTLRNPVGYRMGDELLIEVKLNTGAVHTSPLAAAEVTRG